MGEVDNTSWSIQTLELTFNQSVLRMLSVVRFSTNQYAEQQYIRIQVARAELVREKYLNAYGDPRNNILYQAQQALGDRGDSPSPAGGTTKSWQNATGLRSESLSSSSGTEVIYGSPEWYDESLPALPSFSPASKTLVRDEFAKELDEITTDNDTFSSQEGKTID